MEKPTHYPNRKEYDQARIRIALNYAPPIHDCADCGYPVIKGYCCTTCGSVHPTRELTDAEYDARYKAGYLGD